MHSAHVVERQLCVSWACVSCASVESTVVVTVLLRGLHAWTGEALARVFFFSGMR